MGENIKTVIKKPIGKADILHTITVQLLNGLTMLKEQLGDKKYEKRIKKAAKFLVEGLKKTSPKKQSVTAKKAAKAISEIPKTKKVAKEIKIKPIKKQQLTEAG